MKFSSIAVLALAAASSSVVALTPAQWRAQSIYQVLTDRFARTDGSTTAACNTGNQAYCGGTWRGIISHLDYIQNMGFTAVWISPIVKNIAASTLDGSAYHGYWAQDIYSLNSNFGTAADLIALSAALHARGMYLMVDVVTNHMGYAGCGNCVDYSTFNPFNSQSYYHPFCLIDYTNETSVKVCWAGDNIVSLPDLKTEDSTVQSMWNSWIAQMVSTYSIDGLRIDSAKSVNQDFFPSFQAAAGGIHILGEIFDGNPTYVCPYQNYMSGMLNFPAYYWITQAFQSTSGSISNLANGINTMISSCKDTTLLGSFLENHDVVRFPSLNSDLSLAKNAIAFTILADGTPIIYAGQEQHYNGGGVPYDREATWLSGYSTTSTLYTWIASLNQIRNWAAYKDAAYLTYKATPSYTDSSTIVMRKGNAGTQIVGVFSNKGASGSSYTLTLSSSVTGFTASQSVVEVMACTTYTTDSSGNLNVAMASGLSRVFYPAAALAGSGICGTSVTTKSTTTTAAATTLVTSTSTTAASCPTTVAVTFNELVTTSYGTNVKLVGSISALGSWSTSSGVALSASGYTSANPLWAATVNIAPGTSFTFKFIKVDSSGTVTWESDPNRSFTVPSCVGSTTVSTSWR